MPAAANRWARARPMPLPPPVTMHALSASSPDKDLVCDAMLSPLLRTTIRVQHVAGRRNELTWEAVLAAHQGDARYCRTNAIAMLPSPTAAATRLTELRRTSPHANTPGTLDSSKYGERLCDQHPARSTSSPVST